MEDSSFEVQISADVKVRGKHIYDITIFSDLQEGDRVKLDQFTYQISDDTRDDNFPERTKEQGARCLNREIFIRFFNRMLDAEGF